MVNNPIFGRFWSSRRAGTRRAFVERESSRILSSLTGWMLSKPAPRASSPRQVAVMADKVVEKTRGKAATLRATARSTPSDGGKQPVEFSGFRR